jgi:hypothetical protein
MKYRKQRAVSRRRFVALKMPQHRSEFKLVNRWGDSRGFSGFEGLADYKSAIQQTTSLRYSAVAGYAMGAEKRPEKGLLIRKSEIVNLNF